MARPIDGKETKKNASVKLEPKILAKIIKEYGSYTEWVNIKIKGDKKLRG